jgi:hypothetical protein
VWVPVSSQACVLRGGLLASEWSTGYSPLLCRRLGLVPPVSPCVVACLPVFGVGGCCRGVCGGGERLGSVGMVGWARCWGSEETGPFSSVESPRLWGGLRGVGCGFLGFCCGFGSCGGPGLWWVCFLRIVQWTRASCFVVCFQVVEGAWWMPWHQGPMKDVGACDIPRGAGNQAVIRGFPNGVTWHSLWGVAAV